MSATLAPSLPTQLGPPLLAHLDDQLTSARRLLDRILEQGRAVRRRDVDAVLQALADVQGEMERRGRMERDRTTLLQHAGAMLGTPGHAVTLEALQSVLNPSEAAAAASRSAELRGLLAEIAQQHGVNRSLMKQELAFLDHLTRMLGGTDAADTGYSRPAYGGPGANGPTFAPRPSAMRALDLTA
jgi:hypothetical protein